MYFDRHVNQIKGALTNGRMTLKAIWLPFSAWLNPSRPTAPAMMMEGVILIDLVIRRRIQGFMVKFSCPSETICPAMVHTMPADVPESSKANAKSVPAAGAIDLDNKSWMVNKSAPSASGLPYKDAPA